MNVYMYSNRTEDSYSATGEYKDGKLIVKQGSKIAKKLKENFRPYANVVAIRTDAKYVDENSITVRDIEFSSASAAAQFVSGRSTDGLLAWKIKRGVALRTIVKK